MGTDTVGNNRVNIPAICRLPGAGSGCLVAPGLILTSLTHLRSKTEAARMKARFFETGKQAVVEVDLLPNKVFFVSAFPDYLDYALVACDTRGIYNVKPVLFPVLESQWADVEERDVVLVVQHPIARENEPPPADIEVKNFKEVVRKRGEVMFFNHDTYESAGCPVFNDKGTLVGMYSQGERDGEGLVSRAVHVKEIAKHLFANAKIGLLGKQLPTKEVWRTWHKDGDVTRLLRIIQNFPEIEVVEMSMEELCKESADPDKLVEIIRCKGAKIILEALTFFRADETIVKAALRTLWNMSVGDDSRKLEIIQLDACSVIIGCIEKFTSNQDIAEYGCVLLYNLTGLLEQMTHEICSSIVTVVLRVLETYPTSEVLVKFALGVLTNISKCGRASVESIVNMGGIERVVAALQDFPHNEYLLENAILLLAAIASHIDFVNHSSMQAAVVPLTKVLRVHSTNKNMARNGNTALWYMCLNPASRVALIRIGGLDVLEQTIDAVAQTL